MIKPQNEDRRIEIAGSNEYYKLRFLMGLRIEFNSNQYVIRGDACYL